MVATAIASDGILFRGGIFAPAMQTKNKTRNQISIYILDVWVWKTIVGRKNKRRTWLVTFLLAS